MSHCINFKQGLHFIAEIQIFLSNSFSQILLIVIGFFIDYSNIQKQPLRSVLKKRFSENMQQIFRRKLMRTCDFIKVAMQLY